MDIAIFESVTTESALRDLEVEGEKYDGLYVDMDNAPERKYVKDKAAEIQGLIKKVSAHRIADKKAYGAKVEAQAALITNRLNDANFNFQILIDDYTVERKKILDAEKARKQAILDAEQKELDHEMALLINKTYEFDKALELSVAKEEQKRVEAEALKKATDRLFALGETQERVKINAENARLANKEHCAKVNNTILTCLLNEGFDEHEAKKFIRLAAQNKLPQLTINY